MTNKVVLNCCYGGYGLSEAACEWLSHNYGLSKAECHDLARHDKRLVECVEKLGEKADGFCAELSIKTFSGNMYIITEYDGYESLKTPDSMNWITIE